MSNFRINAVTPSTSASVTVAPRRTRRTARVEEPSFGSVMKAGGNALLRGVETAAGVVGGPLLSGAVSAAAGAAGTGSGSPGPGAGTGAGGDSDVFDRAQQLQEQAQFFNMQYLELQQRTQQDARRFTTLSNLAKAEHDNAKNILRNVSS